MEVKAKLKDISRSYLDNKTVFSFETQSMIAAEELERMQDADLRVKVVRYRKKRSLSANALFWHCVGKIAEAAKLDKWDVYLYMLRHYGKFTYIVCKPNMVDAIKQQWRECEEWNSVNINGKPAVQMLCYFGSSSYSTKEMARLIDGAIQEMMEMGLDLPMTQDVQVALEQWETVNGQHNSE